MTASKQKSVKPTTFKPGQSGNPKGRPAGKKNTIRQLTNEERIKIASGDDLTPLQFALSVMKTCDGSVSLDHRMKAMEIAMPYMHKKLPMAIEGGDPKKPLMLFDVGQLQAMSPDDLNDAMLKIAQMIEALTDKVENEQ